MVFKKKKKKTRHWLKNDCGTVEVGKQRPGHVGVGQSLPAAHVLAVTPQCRLQGLKNHNVDMKISLRAIRWVRYRCSIGAKVSGETIPDKRCFLRGGSHWDMGECSTTISMYRWASNERMFEYGSEQCCGTGTPKNFNFLPSGSEPECIQGPDPT